MWLSCQYAFAVVFSSVIRVDSLTIVLVLGCEELFFLLDDSSLKPADDVDRRNDDNDDQQYDLNSLEVADQCFNSGGEGEAEAGKYPNPNRAARQGQEAESQEPEVCKPVEYRAGGSKAVDVFDDEYR